MLSQREFGWEKKETGIDSGWSSHPSSPSIQADSSCLEVLAGDGKSFFFFWIEFGALFLDMLILVTASLDLAQTSWNIHLLASHFCSEIECQTTACYFFFNPKPIPLTAFLISVNQHSNLPVPCVKFPGALFDSVLYHRYLVQIFHQSPEVGSFSWAPCGRLWGHCCHLWCGLNS